MRADPSRAGRCHGVDTTVSPTRADLPVRLAPWDGEVGRSQTRADEDQSERAV
jgi:hypothetical protein